MTEFSVELLLTKTKELYPDATPRIIHDNGSQYTNDVLKKLLAQFGMADSKTMPYHPQSNGKIERFHRTLRTEYIRRTPYIELSDAEIRMSEWITFYNSERLKVAISYLTPDEVFEERMKERIAERENKFYTANIKRHDYWKSQQEKIAV